MERPKIATMGEPSARSREAATIVNAYDAREHLGIASRWETPDGCRFHLDEGLWCLRAAILRCHDQPKVKTQGARAIAATEAAIALGEVALSYSSAESDFEKKQHVRALSRWKMSAEQAMREAHRFLAMLADAYPDAYVVEEL